MNMQLVDKSDADLSGLFQQVMKFKVRSVSRINVSEHGPHISLDVPDNISDADLEGMARVIEGSGFEYLRNIDDEAFNAYKPSIVTKLKNWFLGK